MAFLVLACGGGADVPDEMPARTEPAEPVTGAHAPGDTIDAFLQEYVIDIPTRLPSPAVLRVVNAGSEPHNLKLRPAGRDSLAWSLGDLNPGETRIAPLELLPGGYDAECDLAGHDMRGMRTQVEVGPRSP